MDREKQKLRDTIAAARRAKDPLVMIRVDDLEHLLDELAKPRVRVPSRPLAPEEYRDDFITNRFEKVT